ncbi:MotA/TolQ/ExbB proton channel family protein [Roseobacteraceae bacterium NS-SX3]
MISFIKTCTRAAIAAAALAASSAAAQDTPAMPAPVPSMEIAAPELAGPDGQAPAGSRAPALAALAPAAPPPPQEKVVQGFQGAAEQAMKVLRDGGPSIWVIAALSVITLALILWKVWRLALIGAWSRGQAGKAVAAYENGDARTARAIVQNRRGIRSQVVYAVLAAKETMPEDRAREETARVARLHLASAATGLGALELIATIAPLLGLLGTVLGMIAAFQALQAAGSKADPALLAGGIWEALLTTAAGMAVAIPASAALAWFEAVIGRIRRDIEDSATRLFVAAPPGALKLAAE